MLYICMYMFVLCGQSKNFLFDDPHKRNNSGLATRDNHKDG